MKKWKIKLSYPSGEIRETWIEAETEAEAGQKFFRRKDGAKMLAEGEVTVEITEDRGEIKIDYSREELIQICEDAIRPQRVWHDRDSYSAQRGVADSWMLLKAGVEFEIEVKGRLETDHDIIWIRFKKIEGFRYHKLGEEGYDEETHYLPTPERLQRVGEKDWY